jgi:hypothetical protein
MSKVEIDLQNLSTLDAEIRIKENRKIALQSELESLAKEISTSQDKNNKEIAQAKQLCEIECREKINEANRILKSAEEKLKAVSQREKDSEAISEQMKQLEEKSRGIAEAQKIAEKSLSSATEKEHKADLLIEQYTKRLNELGGVKEETKEEKPKKKKQE